MIIRISETEKLQNDPAYQEFVRNHPGTGFLKIRASSAGEAIPIEGVKITVSKEIGDNTIIFFEGITDDSGMINGIKLPTPERIQSDEEVPRFAAYDLHAVYEKQNFDKLYNISLCCGFGIIQYINITPDVESEMRDYNGN